MYDAFNIALASPNANHNALLMFSGEIRFGPPYYSLSLDGNSFGQRIFGSPLLWSRSSTFLAVQEWLTLDYSEGPITALVVIDVRSKQEVSVAQAKKGFIVPETFEDPVLVYRTEYAGQATGQHIEADISQITEWKAFSEYLIPGSPD
jgi:hypothetical protein